MLSTASSGGTGVGAASNGWTPDSTDTRSRRALSCIHLHSDGRAHTRGNNGAENGIGGNVYPYLLTSLRSSRGGRQYSRNHFSPLITFLLLHFFDPFALLRVAIYILAKAIAVIQHQFRALVDSGHSTRIERSHVSQEQRLLFPRFAASVVKWLVGTVACNS